MTECQQSGDCRSHGNSLTRMARDLPPPLADSVEAWFVQIPNLSGRKPIGSRLVGFAPRPCFLLGTMFANVSVKKRRGSSMIAFFVYLGPIWQGDDMKPSEMAARFAAFAWYAEHRRAPSRIVRNERRGSPRRTGSISCPWRTRAGEGCCSGSPRPVLTRGTELEQPGARRTRPPASGPGEVHRSGGLLREADAQRRIAGAAP